MNDQQELLENEKAAYEEKARSLRSFVRELTAMAGKHGTDAALIESDLARARSDISFYEAEAERISATIAEQAGRGAFQVYEDSAGEWRWRLLAGNRRVIANSGEGYHKRQDCLHAIELVKDSKGVPVEGAD